MRGTGSERAERSDCIRYDPGEAAGAAVTDTEAKEDTDGIGLGGDGVDPAPKKKAD